MSGKNDQANDGEETPAWWPRTSENRWEGSAPARSKKKDEKRVEKAQARLKPSDAMTEAVREMDSMIDVESDEKEEYGLLEHSARWDRMLADINQAGSKKQYSTAEKKSTELLDDIARVEKEYHMQYADEDGKEGRMFLSPEEQMAYFGRAQARKAMGNLQGAIDDCTEAVAMMDALERSKYGRNRVCILQARGESLEELFRSTKNPEHLEGAIEDFRACWAIVQAGRDKWNDTDDSISIDVAQNLLKVLVRKRLLSSTLVRPLYTAEQRNDIEKELGLGCFCKRNYHCFACAKVSDALHRCGGCKKAWFCDRECQRKAWKSGHNKKACSNMAKTGRFFLLPDEYKAGTDRDFLNDVMHSFIDNEGEPVVILHDPSTGRYYNALSDANVYFFPSEAEQIEFLSDELLEMMRCLDLLN